MKQNSMAGRIVKNVNRVLEVIPRTLNKDAEVIKLDFKKARKARKSTSKSGGVGSKARRMVGMKARRAKSAVRTAKSGIAARKGRSSPIRARNSKRKSSTRTITRAA